MAKTFSLALIALLLAACAPAASAAAELLVPPGNSAANQYTETFPTSKGEEEEKGKEKDVVPGKVLGDGKARALEDKGPVGKAVADFAAETAPTVTADSSSGNDANGGGKTGHKDGNGSQDDGEGQADKGGGGGTPSGGGSGPSAGSGADSGGAQPSGSSGLGEVVSQATGTSSGTLGWLLPLILVAVVIWSAAYVWRDRQQRVV